MKKVVFISLLCLFAVLALTFGASSNAHAKSLTLNWAYGSYCPGSTVPDVRIASGTTLCLWGSGYQGLGDSGGPGNQSNVHAVYAYHTTMWIRYYDSTGGHYCAGSASVSGGSYYFSNASVTQVSIGSTGGYPWCP